MSASPVTVRVNLPGREYDILIGYGLLRDLGRQLTALCPAGRAAIVTDTNVGPLYLDAAADALRAAGVDAEAVVIPAGEASKSLAQLSALYDELAKRRHGRDEPIVALGGGVVGDLAGFAAATWHRGVPFAQCPTTLEAMIDAAIGGKTAINHEAGKNLIGAFHQPAFVCIDVACLSTLAPRDYVAGLAESVKHAVIADADFFDWHETNAAAITSQAEATLVELIRRNCAIKAAFVEQDERETAQGGVGRAALNFGHTVGHALEVQSQFDLRHGEAVALGMVAAMELAVQRCGFSASERDRVEALLAAMGLPVRMPAGFNAADLQERLAGDKKVRRRTIRFVVPTRIGQVCWLEGPDVADLQNALARLTAN